MVNREWGLSVWEALAREALLSALHVGFIKN